MAIALEKHEVAEVLPSLKRYLAEALDVEMGDLQAQLLLDYCLSEIGPYAYNQGVKDAEHYFRTKLEDLAGSCYAQPRTYWAAQKRRQR